MFPSPPLACAQQEFIAREMLTLQWVEVATRASIALSETNFKMA